MSHSALAAASSLIVPWLALTLLLQYVAGRAGLMRRGAALAALSGAAALAVCAAPVGGHSVGGWVRGVSANFSIPLMAILAATAWEHTAGRPLMRDAEWTSFWAFGLLAGATLYPFALGVGPVDPYEWGWQFSPLFPVVSLAAAWLIWFRRPLGWLLLLASAACRLRMLESGNYWDYLVDPVYFVTCCVALSARLWSRAGVGRRPSRATL